MPMLTVAKYQFYVMCDGDGIYCYSWHSALGCIQDRGEEAPHKITVGTIYPVRDSGDPDMQEPIVLIAWFPDEAEFYTLHAYNHKKGEPR